MDVLFACALVHRALTDRSSGLKLASSPIAGMADIIPLRHCGPEIHLPPSRQASYLEGSLAAVAALPVYGRRARGREGFTPLYRKQSFCRWGRTNAAQRRGVSRFVEK